VIDMNQNEPQSALKPESGREISSVSLIAPVLKVEEALKNAANVTISGVETRILTVEYLVAIMLQKMAREMALAAGKKFNGVVWGERESEAKAFRQK